MHVRPVLGIIFPGLKNFMLNNFNQILSYLGVVWKCLKNLNQWEREDFREKKGEKKISSSFEIGICSLRPLSPSSDKQTSNFSLQYHYLFKHTDPENKGNDHQK